MSQHNRLAHRIKTHDAGLKAEVVASSLISKSGGEIIANRVKNACGEVDIISICDNVISFTEVKRRPTFDQGVNAVSEKAWRRISKAAEIFMSVSYTHLTLPTILLV